MLKRSELNSTSENSVDRLKRIQRKNRRKQRSRGRRLNLEGLESRQLLAAEVVDLPSVDPALFATQAPRNIGTVGAFVMTEGEAANSTGANDSLQTATFVPLGTGAGQEDTIDINGALPFINDPNTSNFTFDIDHFAMDLRAGDILDIAVEGAAGAVTTFFENGSFWFGGDDQQNILQPSSSPLQNAGNVTISQVVPEDGRYFVQIAPITTQGTYTAGLRVYRPVAESLPIGAQQVIYLDLDGGTYPSSVFPSAGLPPGIVRFIGLPESLPTLGVQVANEAALNDLIDTILLDTELQLQSIVSNGSNGDFDSTGTPGEHGVLLLNSRDHADPGNHPLVTRVQVGLLAESGFGGGLFGISQSVDIGNFDMSEIVLVLLDNFLPGATQFPIDPSKSQLDAVGRLLAGVTTHEVGHSFGERHTNGDNFTFNIMDEGPGANTFPGLMGVGPDGIFGTTDDLIPEFAARDQFSIAEGIFGFSHTAKSLSWALSTGTQGGVISGRVVDDLRADQIFTTDPPLEGVTVFADTNGNGVQDTGEQFAVTDENGDYVLRVASGTYTVTVVPPDGFGGDGVSRSVTATVGQTVAGVNFGLVSLLPDATGVKWRDDNGNGFLDAGEPGVEGVYIYLDLDGDNRPDLGEPFTFTDADGRYNIDLPGPGTYTIREVLEPGFLQTFPDPLTEEGEHTFVYNGTSLTNNFNFGNQPSRDYGDALLSYGNPNHGIVTGLSIGAVVDRDIGPFDTADASGDDNDGSLDLGGNLIDDEDGVFLSRPLAPGEIGQVQVTLTNTTGSTGFLQGWIDFDGDGSFSTLEQIATDLQLGTGDHLIDFSVPATPTIGNTIARFRYSHESGLGPDGEVDSGEVEDHLVGIQGTADIANDDVFRVTRNSLSNPLDVLANDFETPLNPLRISTAITTTALGGIVEVAADGRSVFYTPPNGVLGQDSFTYEVVDSNGEFIDSATVTVNIEFLSDTPIAVDDSFNIPQGAGAVNRALNVLDNDIASTNGGLTITSVTPGSAGGSITIVGGGQSLRYTALPGFNGTEQFTYSVQDPIGNVDTATVTLNLIPGSDNDDIVAFDFLLRDAVNGTSLIDSQGRPIDIPVGSEFILTVTVDDLRDRAFADDAVVSAFIDILYSNELVQVVSDQPTFGPFFGSPGNQDQFANFDLGTPGLIDEAGAIQTSINPPQTHAAPVELFSIRLKAVAPGVALFQADPADAVTSETIVFESDLALTPSQLRLASTSVSIRDFDGDFPSAIDDVFSASIDTNNVISAATDSQDRPITSVRSIPLQPNVLDVLANDNLGTPGILSEFRIEREAGFGEVAIDDRGTPDLSDDRVTYLANENYSGPDSFTYSIVVDGIRSLAEVSLDVDTLDANTQNYLMSIDANFVDDTGAPTTSASVGDIIGVQIDVDDLRNNFGALSFGDPALVFAAFTDLLYDADILSPVTDPAHPSFNVDLGFAVDFGAFFNASSASGLPDRPGIIDEFGTSDSRSGIQSNQAVDPRNLATIFFDVNSVGVTTVNTSPADNFPFRDSLLIDVDEAIPVEKIIYNTSDPLTVGTSGGEGEAPLHNIALPQDVNNDGFVTPIDALLGINALNRLPAEGESASEGPLRYYDVNGDGKLSPIDILQVINFMNRASTGGEGELAAPQSAGVETVGIAADEAVSSLAANSSELVVGSAESNQIAAATPVSSAEHSSDDDEDDVLSLLADDVAGLWN